jgi:hypothetical protein
VLVLPVLALLGLLARFLQDLPLVLVLTPRLAG